MAQTGELPTTQRDLLNRIESGFSRYVVGLTIYNTSKLAAAGRQLFKKGLVIITKSDDASVTYAPTIVEATETPAIEDVETAAEIETDGVLVGEEAMEIECATCGKLFWSLDSDHVECDTCDEAATDFDFDVRLNEALIGTEKPLEAPAMKAPQEHRYDAVVVARSSDMNEVFIFIRSTSFGFAIRVDAGEWLAKFLLTGDEITFTQNWDWTHNPRAIDIKRKEKPAEPVSESEESYKDLWMSNRKIDAIRIYRLKYKASFREAYDALTAMASNTLLKDPRDAEIKRLQDEIRQLKDERDEAQTQVAQMKHRQARYLLVEHALSSYEGFDYAAARFVSELFHERETEDRGEAGKGIFFG